MSDLRGSSSGMTCYRCGINIDTGYWLADGGPLCSECGQDVRAVNIKRNRERERRETSMSAKTRIAYHREDVGFKVFLDSADGDYPCHWAKVEINKDQEIVVFVKDGEEAREVLRSLRDEINKTLGESL